MLSNPIMDELTAMRLTGMAKALTEQMEMQDINSLTFDERLGLMVDREMTEREDRRLATRLRKAKLRVQACMSGGSQGEPALLKADCEAIRWGHRLQAQARPG
jgi:hypothetical protein